LNREITPGGKRSSDAIDTKHAGVATYLTLLQDTIKRMAANSHSCKTWCISLVTALVAFVGTTKQKEFLLMSLIPILIFYFLDTYYLYLEIRFRNGYNGFVNKLRQGSATEGDLFQMNPITFENTSFGKALSSLSIWPFYVPLLTMALLAFFFLNLGPNGN